MPNLRSLRAAVVLCALAAVPGLALATPPVALGTLEVRGTRAAPPWVMATRSPPIVPNPALETLPLAARAPFIEQQRAVAERLAIAAAMRAHGGSGATQGPTLRDVMRRESDARERLRQALERSTTTLEAEGWLLLAELRLEDTNERDSSGDGALSTAALTPIRAAYAHAAALGGTHTTGLWARLRESSLAASAGDFAAAQSALAVVIANSPTGPLHATALVEQADLAGGPQAAALYARALAEGADAPLRVYVRFATMLATRFSDPLAARDAGASILTEGDDATAELAAPIVGELLVRTGDPVGMSLPAALSAERAARVLEAAGEVALEVGERPWAEYALRAAVEHSPSSRPGRAAAARIASLSAAALPPRETVPQWLVHQATRCQSDTLSADAPDATGDLDVVVRRQSGVARVIARLRPGAGLGATHFKRCIEGTLPDPPALDTSTIYRGTIRLR